MVTKNMWHLCLLHKYYSYYTTDLTTYLSLHCYGYVVWRQTCDLQPVFSLTLILTTYKPFFLGILSSSPQPNCFCESYKELQLYL